MSDKVQPSINAASDGFILAGAIRYAGGTAGWIQKSGSALLADNDADISGTPLNAFAESHSGSNLDVTIDTGEGVTGGAWFARDTTTSVTLTASTNGQQVYVGWDADAANTVIVGKSGAFNSDDPKLHIWTFDTDSNGVTSATDKRPLGEQTDLGTAQLGDDSTLGRWVSDAVAGSAVGTPGDHNNELFRLPGNTSDLVHAVDDGDGAVSVAYNAYFDGSWKYVTGNTRAYLLQFSSDEIRLRVSSSASGGTDGSITWVDVAVTDAGDIVGNGGAKIWDESAGEVPQSQLGGPPSSIGSYPLKTADLDGSEGSSNQYLQTDGTQSGVSWATVSASAEWTTIETTKFTDASSAIDYDTGVLGTTYDMYKLDLVLESHAASADVEYFLQLNNDGTSNYEWTVVENAGAETRGPWPAFDDIAKTYDERVGHATLQISSSVTSNTVSESYPTVSARSAGKPQHHQLVNGWLKKDYPTVDQFRVDTDGNKATGVFKLQGKDF